MDRKRKSLEELNVLDDFLMTAVACNEEVGPDFCRQILSILLNRKIGRVHVTAQKVIPSLTPELRGIRMDVEVVEEMDDALGNQIACNVYDIEPHLQKDTHLPKHNRFYQARVDSRYVSSGERDFGKLPNLFVITITPYDPFGKGYMMYRFQNRCDEVLDLTYEDGLEYIYFNTVGTKGGTKAIGELLRYFQSSKESNATNDDLQQIHKYVSKVKILPEVRDQYMLLGEYLDYKVAEGVREGIAEALEEIEREKEKMIKEAVEEAVQEAVEEAVQEAVEEAVQEAVEEAVQKQAVQSILVLLEDCGTMSPNLLEKLRAQQDPDVLKKWLKLAARVENLEDFESKM